jgi:uncharacterized protein HemX
MGDMEMERDENGAILIHGWAVLTFLILLLMAIIAAFAGGYQYCDTQKQHLITVQEIVEKQDGILEDCAEYRRRIDLLEIDNQVNRAEISSLKEKWKEIKTGRRK